MHHAEWISSRRPIEPVLAFPPNFVVPRLPGPNGRATAQQPSYVPRSYRSTRPFRIQRQHGPRSPTRSDRREDSIITNSQLVCRKSQRPTCDLADRVEIVVIRKRFCGPPSIRSRVTSRKISGNIHPTKSSLANITNRLEYIPDKCVL